MVIKTKIKIMHKEKGIIECPAYFFNTDDISMVAKVDSEIVLTMKDGKQIGLIHDFEDFVKEITAPTIMTEHS